MEPALYGLLIGIAGIILILVKLHTIQNHTDVIGEMLHIYIYHPEHIEDMRTNHEIDQAEQPDVVLWEDDQD